MQSLKQQEGRDQSTIYIHCDHPEQRQLLFKQEVLAADNKCQYRVADQCQQCSDHSTCNSYDRSGDQIILLKHRCVVFQSKFAGEQINATAQCIGSIVK